MTDLLDLTQLESLQLHEDQNTIDPKLIIEYYKKQNQKNSTIKKQKDIQNIFPSTFIQISLSETIMMYLSDSGSLIRVVFKLTSEKQIFKIKSTYLRTFFIKQFVKSQACNLSPKLNPLTGEVSLNFEIIKMNQQNNSKKQIKETVISELKKNKWTIIDFWKRILDISKGLYDFQTEGDKKQKVMNIIALSNLSKLQNQNQTFQLLQYQNTQNQKQLTIFINSLTDLLNYGSLNTMSCFRWKSRLSYNQIIKQKQVVSKQNVRLNTNFSNLIELKIDSQQIQKLMKYQKSKPSDQFLKIKDRAHGPLCLQKSTHERDEAQRIIRNLDYLDLRHQFNFLHYYFVYRQEKEVFLYQIVQRKCKLSEYFQRNNRLISFQVKLQIFLQIYFCIQLLWEKYDIFINDLRLSSFSLLKKFVVKLQQASHWQKISRDPKHSHNRYLLKCEMMLRLYKMFQKIFYNHDLYWKRSSKKTNYQFQQKKFLNPLIKMSINQKSNDSYLYGNPHILNAICYCFQNYENYQQSKDQLYINHKDDEQFEELYEESKHDINKIIDKGNLNLVFGTILKSFQLIKFL